jgi:hypothetical protein
MSTRSKATAEKRRKEMARKEKQRLKAERRLQRKLERAQDPSGEAVPIEALPPQENL